MKSTIYSKMLRVGVFLIFLQYATTVSAQFPFSTTMQGSQGFGTQSPPDSTKLPTLDQRAEALKNAGVPQDILNEKVLPNTGTPSNPIAQPLPSQLGADGKPLTEEELEVQAKKEALALKHAGLNGSGLGTDAPVIYRFGDNVREMTLFNSRTGKIDTFRIKDDWYARFLEEEKTRKQLAFDNALRNKNTIFGQHIFIKNDFTRADTSAYSPPESYLVQTGDKFLVQVTGAAELFEYLEVDKDGTVFRQFMGKKVVAGTTYSQARKTIENGYKKMVPSGTTIIISLVRNKNVISVNVTGEVKEPGTYTLPNITNAISALYAAKGIGAMGSLRTIYIKREGKIVKTIDLYDYLINGNTEQIYLKNNDFIFVPMQKNIVSIDGGVKRPMRYELKDGETMKDLLHYCGGLTYDATKLNAQISRIENGKDGLIDFNIEYEGNKKLQDGDEIFIRTVYKHRDEIVQINGPVKYPGTYDWTKGKRVKDLIDKAGGLTPEAYLDRAYIIRIPKPGELSYIPVNLKDLKDTTNNISVQYLDQLLIFNSLAFKKSKHIVVVGEVNKPDVITLTQDMTLKDLLLLVGGTTRDVAVENVELYSSLSSEEAFEEKIIDEQKRYNELADRLKNKDEALQKARLDMLNKISNAISKEKAIIRRITINQDWQNDASLDTILVNKYSVLTFYSKYQFMNLYTVEASGALNKPTSIIATPSTTLKDLIYTAGGLDKEAEINYIELYTRMRVAEKGPFALKSDNAEVLRIKVDNNWQTNPIYDSIKVQPYYKIVIPDQRKYIQKGNIEIKGFVTSPGKYDYKPKMTLKDAIYLAGGLKIETEFNNIEISRILDIENTNNEVIPVKVKSISVATSQDWQKDEKLDKIILLPFDQVFIRPNPDFKLQEGVSIQGEVSIPGEYNKAKPEERLSDLVARSGGLTPLAFTEAAYLTRPEYGMVTIDLTKALNRPGSKFDLTLREGDVLTIPKLSEVITVQGYIFKDTVNTDKNIGTLDENERNFMYDPAHRNMKYYVDLAGGFQDRTKKRDCTVSYPNGSIKKAKRHFFFVHTYPKVSQGAVITIAEKANPNAKLKEGEIDRGALIKERLTEIMGFATSMITLLVLVKAATK